MSNFKEYLKKQLNENVIKKLNKLVKDFPDYFRFKSVSELQKYLKNNPDCKYQDAINKLIHDKMFGKKKSYNEYIKR